VVINIIYWIIMNKGEKKSDSIEKNGGDMKQEVVFLKR
jgi:hypothetical protein